MFMVPAKLTNTSFCLHSFIQDLFFHKKHWFKTLSLVMKIQLEPVIVLNLKHIKSLSQPSSVCYWQKVKEGGLVLQGKLYCYSTPTLHTNEKCFLFLFHFFCFYFLVYWDYCCKFSDCDSFDSFKVFYEKKAL